MCRREKQFSRNSITISGRRDSISKSENQIIESHVYCRAWWKTFNSRMINSKSVITKKKLSWIMWSKSRRRLKMLNQKTRNFRNHDQKLNQVRKWSETESNQKMIKNWIKSENDQKLNQVREWSKIVFDHYQNQRNYQKFSRIERQC